jgi:hypothetical protein
MTITEPKTCKSVQEIFGRCASFFCRYRIKISLPLEHGVHGTLLIMCEHSDLTEPPIVPQNSFDLEIVERVPISWVNSNIAIGNYLDDGDIGLIRREGFRGILALNKQLCDENASLIGVGKVIGIPLIDGPGNDPRLFNYAVDCLTSLIKDYSPVLVHCHAGRSRSPAVVAAYLIKNERMTPKSAFGRIAKVRELYMARALIDMVVAHFN